MMRKENSLLKDEKVKKVSAFLSFLPQKIVNSKILNQKPANYEILPVTLFYGDISGFTAMSEKLAKLGKEGSEEVTKIINHFFEALIKVIMSWGGDIYRFGGDAILAIFIDDKLRYPKEIRAFEAAKQIINFVKEHKRIVTRKGSFQIKIHCGITSGRVYFKDLENDFFVGGILSNQLLKIVERAKAGEIVVNSGVQKMAKDEFKTSGKNIWKWKKKKSRPRYLEKKRGIVQIMKGKESHVIGAVSPYLTEWIRERINLKPSFDPKDGEHRKVTSVFLHFTGIPYEKDPERSSLLLKGFYKLLRETSERYGGYLNKLDVTSNGERAIIIFGFPVALEDDERRAALFAYELLNKSFIKSKGLDLRVGINSGSVFSGPVGSNLRREYTVMGDSVNLTARIASSAKKGEILITESVFNKVFEFFDYKPVIPKALKGKKEKVRLYRILQKKVVDKSLLSKWLSESEKIVGRAKETKKIKELISAAKKGKGQILVIKGEAGIGKSRLTQELIKELKKSRFKIFEGDCISYGSAFSYHPWVDILTDFFDILHDDTLKERKKKIRKKMVKVDRKLSEWFPIIGEIMGVSFPETTLTKFLDAKIKKQRVFDITFDFMKYITKKKPVSIIVEDLHWADTASMELVNYIGRNIKNKPFLFVLVYRPLKEKEEFTERSYTTQITVKELTKDDSLNLVKNLLAIKDIPQDFRKLIIEKSQGNPFYIEELVKSLIEQGYVVEERGIWKFTGDIKKLQLPDTVEAVILSRIDRLDIHQRDVLQVASVIGREFVDFLIKGIYPDLVNLNKSLRNLNHLDLIKKEKGKKQIRYFFKHILTREVAYETLSYARRRELHKKAGIVIEEELKDRRKEFLGLLSYHFFEGCDYEKSLIYSVEAGEKAKRVYANEEAIEFFTRAIESYEFLDKQ
ncbi:AAA family ATPase [candidate division WOR-3 bacterium]|nr:AAA family ATPase [candidate division WOR-3 bacterium]